MTTRCYVCAAIGTLLLLIAACSPSQRVLMPPRMDLHAWGTIGMLDFAADPPGTIGPYTAREFLAGMQAAQPGVAVLELGSQHQALLGVGHGTLNPEAVRAIGKRHGVDALLVGLVTSRSPAPNFSLRNAADRLSIGASADVEAGLRVRLYDARSGATVWSTTSHARQTVARAVVGGDDFASVSAGNPNDAETHLVHQLVRGASGDLWPYWVRR